MLRCPIGSVQSARISNQINFIGNKRRRHTTTLCNMSIVNVMFKTRAAVFYRDLKPRGAADKTRAASFLNGFKNIPGKACVKRVHNNDAFVGVRN